MQKKTTDTPLRVAAVGMDKRSRNTLELFFEGPCRGSCVLVDESEAEIALLDMDGIDAGKLFEKHSQRFPARPVIVLSLSERPIEGTVQVRKPMSAERLLEALEQVRARLAAAPAGRAGAASGAPDAAAEAPAAGTAGSNVVPIGTPDTPGNRRVGSSKAAHRAALQLDEKEIRNIVGTAADIDPYDPEQRASVCFDPDAYMLGRLGKAFAEARETGAAVRLEDSWSTITAFPKQDSLFTELKDTQLRTVCRMPNRRRDLRVSRLGDREATRAYADLERGGGLQDMDAFLWKLALWTSRGRVPEGTNLSLPVFLRYWPNMTRLLLPPHALRIAALWAHQPHSLLQTASALKLPQRYVFAFYSAARTLDLAGPCRRSADMLVEPSTGRPANRGVLARILQRLKIA